MTDKKFGLSELEVLVHFGFGRVASLELSRLFKAGEERETAASRRLER
jgi:hypothetical protein